jgi:hypothetical protein
MQDINAVTFTFPPHAFEAPSPWAADISIKGVVNNVFKTTPIQGDAMMYGWYAGQLLDGAADEVRLSVWKLLRYRIDLRRVGEIAGYTLNYIEGYAQNLIIGRTAGLTSDEILKNLAAVSNSGASNVALFEQGRSPGTPNGLWLNETLYATIIQGCSTVSGDATLPDGKRRQLLQWYSSFLVGYNQGSIRASEVIYADAFMLAWGMGYADGFRDGYSRGYADGYRAGYAAGWAAAPTDFFGSLGGFISDVGKAAGPVATVISVIASLF